MNKIQKLIFISLVIILVLVTISFLSDTKKDNKNKVVKYKVVYNLYNNIKDNNIDTSTRKYISKLYGYSNDNSENIIMFTKESYVENDIVYDFAFNSFYQSNMYYVPLGTKEEDYAQAINTLNSWKKEVTSIKKGIEQQKAEEQARAESEAAAKRAAESRAAESRAAESRAAESKAAETKKNQTSETKNNSNSNNNNSSSNGSSSGYVLPNSSSSYLSASDVKNLSSYQLMIARNEIYARHGRKFNDSELQAYFNSKSWYKGTVNPEDFSTSVFNDYEIQNIELIQSYE